MTKKLTINYKQLYEMHENNETKWVLILYDISKNHYVGLPVYERKKEGSIFCPSIKKYLGINQIDDYSKSKIKKCIYEKGKPLKVSQKDYNYILHRCKNNLIEFLNKNINNDVEGISYIKWCRDKFIINESSIKNNNLIQNGIYWVNFGIGIGSELRKLRPAILWRSTGDKNIWTVIPLTTKNNGDKYYFHYDLECLKERTAKIESIMNLSYKRIISPYLAIITKADYMKIKKIISQYYLFQ